MSSPKRDTAELILEFMHRNRRADKAEDVYRDIKRLACSAEIYFKSYGLSGQENRVSTLLDQVFLELEKAEIESLQTFLGQRGPARQSHSPPQVDADKPPLESLISDLDSYVLSPSSLGCVGNDAFDEGDTFPESGTVVP